MGRLSYLVLCLQCLCAFVSPEEHARERRDLSMLRMGKRDGVEVLPARAIALPPLVPPNYDIGDEFVERELIVPEGEIARQVWIPRVGKDVEYEGRFVRVPPFPRLGEYLSHEFRRDLNDDDFRQLLFKYPVGGRSARSKRSADAEDQSVAKSEHKRAALPRLGLRDEEFHEEEEEEERAAPLPRLGMVQRAAPLPRLGLREVERSFPRLGLRQYDDYYFDNEVQRAAPLPRLGLRGLDERALPMPRLGYREVEKKAMGMLRMGRSDGSTEEEEEADDAEEKRSMGMLRMGKRPVSMLRMGRSEQAENEKRAMGMLRMGKRPVSMLRMGRSEQVDDEKRAMGMLRMGKRAMGMLRMGKRAMGMLRMGRSDSEETAEKRAMGMLRMGRSDQSDDEKRAMGMLRMGKRPVSMLRMGKRDTESVQEDQDNKEESAAETDNQS